MMSPSSRSILSCVSLLLVCISLSLPVSAFYSPADHVAELTTHNFANKVLKSDEAWLVEFYAPWCGHCKSLVPEYKKAANQLSGVASVGAVDMTQHESFAAQYDIKGFPTIKLFVGNKQKPLDYNGERTASAMVDFVKREVRAHEQLKANKGSDSKKSDSSSSSSKSKKSSGTAVVDLTESTFDELVLNSDELWLVEFFAPWCGHCKNLAPHWASASNELVGVAKLGAVDATVYSALANKYGVKGYPTIKVFLPGKKDKPEDFNGGRTHSDIVTYTKNIAERVVPVKPKPIHQLLDQEVWEETCKDGTCIIAVLPHILDSKATGRQAYLDTLAAVAKTNAKKPFTYLWTEIGSQSALEDALTSSYGGIAFPPVILAVNMKKERYVMMTGSFTEPGITKFIGGIISGAEKTQKLSKKNIVISSIEAWDGKDGQMPVETDTEEDRDSSSDREL